jgi:hypothetical protein
MTKGANAMSITRLAALTAPRHDGSAPLRLLTTHPIHEPEEEDDPRLRELLSRAHELIGALRRGLRVTEMSAMIAFYVRAAREIGVKGERLHDALELLVHEHAFGRRANPAANAALLHDVLRLADPSFRLGSCPHGSTAETVPHWCRLYPHAR